MNQGNTASLKTAAALAAAIVIVWSAAPQSKPVIKEETVAGIEMVYIPEGTFTMGSTVKGKDYSPAHKVKISAFRMSKFEITQKQYTAVTGTNPCTGSKYGEGDERPVFNVSWYEAVEFCNLLSEKNGLKPYYIIVKDDEDSDNISAFDGVKWEVNISVKADGFRLPTEAQWEYACRAGSLTDYYWGKKAAWDTAGKYSWHLFNTGVKRYNDGRFWWAKYQKTQKAGGRKPNDFGLYDMCGNAAEWCFDRYSASYYKADAQADPSGYEGKYEYRVYRGGSILDSPADFTSFKRWSMGAFEKQHMTGIRLVLP